MFTKQGLSISKLVDNKELVHIKISIPESEKPYVTNGYYVAETYVTTSEFRKLLALI